MPQTDEMVYMETEGACANCGFKDSRALTIHHLVPTPPKDESYDNKLVLCHNCHQCHHQGKGPSSEELETIKKRLIVKTLTTQGLNAMKVANRRAGVSASPFLVNRLVEYGYLQHRENTTWHVENDEDDPIKDGIPTEAFYIISEKGRALLEKWKLK